MVAAVLQRAIYISDAVGEAGSNLVSLAQILGVSDANNRRDHLTGVLAFHRGQFIQAVEGKRADLDRLIRRLKADPRHTNLRFLTDGPIKARRHGLTPMLHVALDAHARVMLGDAPLSGLDAEGAETLLRAAAMQDAA